MNIVNLALSHHECKRVIHLYNSYRIKESYNLCSCNNYSPYIKYGTCRFCWKYGRKDDKDVLKIILKTLKL